MTTNRPQENAITRRICIKCGNRLPPPAKTGRPRRYCSIRCKRAVFYAIRRVNRHLQTLEGRLSREQVTAEFDHLQDTHGRGKAERLAALQTQIESAQRKLLELLTNDT